MEKEFTISTMTGRMFNSMTIDLYSHPVSSIIRELVSNADDANIANNNADKEVIVKIPTDHHRLFSVRDFGKGMSDDIISDIFTCVGKTTKSGDNTQTGGYGLGCKTPFCVTNCFFVDTFINGVRTSYMMSRPTKEDIPTVKKLRSRSTKEPDGTLIYFLVYRNDVYDFYREAIDFYKNNDFNIKLLNVQDDDIHKFKVFLEVDHYQMVQGSVYDLNAKIGKVLYSIPTYSMNDWWKTILEVDIIAKVKEMFNIDLNSFDENSLERRIFLKQFSFRDVKGVLLFDNGEITPTISRETINFSDENRKKIEDRMFASVLNIRKEFLDACKTFNGDPNQYLKIRDKFDLVNNILPDEKFKFSLLKNEFNVSIRDGVFISCPETENFITHLYRAPERSCSKKFKTLPYSKRYLILIPMDQNNTKVNWIFTQLSVNKLDLGDYVNRSRMYPITVVKSNEDVDTVMNNIKTSLGDFARYFNFVKIEKDQAKVVEKTAVTTINKGIRRQEAEEFIANEISNNDCKIVWLRSESCYNTWYKLCSLVEDSIPNAAVNIVKRFYNEHGKTRSIIIEILEKQGYTIVDDTNFDFNSWKNIAGFTKEMRDACLRTLFSSSLLDPNDNRVLQSFFGSKYDNFMAKNNKSYGDVLYKNTFWGVNKEISAESMNNIFRKKCEQSIAKISDNELISMAADIKYSDIINNAMEERHLTIESLERKVWDRMFKYFLDEFSSEELEVLNNMKKIRTYYHYSNRLEEFLNKSNEMSDSDKFFETV